MPRYFQASEGQLSYGIEGTKYTAASDATVYFGLIRDESTPPNPNPQTPMSTDGTPRKPHLNSPDPIEYQWTVPFNVLDDNAPFEVALGQRATTTKNSGSSNEYVEHLFTTASRLPTMTVQHNQVDAGLEAQYIGTKSNLTLSWSQGEPVNAEMEVMATTRTMSTGVSTAPTLGSSGVSEKTPFRFNHVGDVTLSDPSGGSTIKTLATISSGEASVDNGLEADHHKGREPYSVVEGSAEDIFEATLDFTITDLDLYQRAAEAKDPVDIEIPFIRQVDSSTSTAIDAMYVRLLKADLTNAPVPDASEGKLEPTVDVAPTDMEIEIRTPP